VPVYPFLSFFLSGKLSNFENREITRTELCHLDRFGDEPIPRRADYCLQRIFLLKELNDALQSLSQSLAVILTNCEITNCRRRTFSFVDDKHSLSSAFVSTTGCYRWVTRGHKISVPFPRRKCQMETTRKHDHSFHVSDTRLNFVRRIMHSIL
jgi:hypothetical protein